jgi:endoglucanase
VEELRSLTDTIEADVMGNVIGFKRGASGGPRVMIAAHMDEIGFLVKHIDDQGFLRLQPVGGWDGRTMMAQRVQVHGFAGQTLRGALQLATKPIHVLTPEEANKAPKVEEFFVDVGLPGERVKELVEIGDMVTMDRALERMGDTVVSKSLDNRLSVFVMIEALRLLKSTPTRANILAVATTQEEVGLRGATTAAYALQPDIGIALDITLANDYPGPQEYEQITQLGKGAAIKISDSSLLCHPKLARHFRDVAAARGIPYQLEILTRGGTDAGGIQRSRGGVPSFTLSIPTRYVHTVNEMAHVQDIQGAIDLLAAYLQEAHTRDYGYADEVQ